jgi:hypothetical protein
MLETQSLLNKLNFKEQGQPVLIVNAPKAYDEVTVSFQGDVHKEPLNNGYDFVQVFGATNEELQTLALQTSKYVNEDALFWLSYPKKTSKTYKGSDCSRESVMYMLSTEGYEPVRQVAIDEDWSALRFRKTDKIKRMTRSFAVTELGKERTEQN